MFQRIKQLFRRPSVPNPIEELQRQINQREYRAKCQIHGTQAQLVKMAPHLPPAELEQRLYELEQIKTKALADLAWQRAQLSAIQRTQALTTVMEAIPTHPEMAGIIKQLKEQPAPFDPFEL